MSENNKKINTLNREDLIREIKDRVNKREDFGGEIHLYQLRIIFEIIEDIFKDVVMSGVTLTIYGLGTLYLKTLKSKKYHDVTSGETKISQEKEVAEFRLSDNIRNLRN